MKQFVGQRVSLDLADDTTLLGSISEVDEVRQVLKLSGASSKTQVNGKMEMMVFPGLLEVLAADIVNIDFIQEEPIRAPTALSAAASPKSSSRNQKNSDWAKDDIRKIKQEDFDFQSNLKLFNKQQIFSEIQSQDKTDVKERLVSHNLSGRGQAQRKLRPSENVLESTDREDSDRILSVSPIPRDRILSVSPIQRDMILSVSPIQRDRMTSLSPIQRDLLLSVSPIQNSLASTSTSTRASTSKSIHSSASLQHLVTAVHSISIRCYEDAQVKKEELYRPIFPFLYLIVETAGRSTASHILAHHSECKEVDIVLGPNFRLNAIAMSAGRHLASKGFTVVIEKQRIAGCEEEFTASVYRDQLAALTALYPTFVKASLRNPSNSVLIACGTSSTHQTTVYLEYCPSKPSQSTSLFFDPLIPISALSDTSRIFLMDSGIPSSLLSINTEALFRDAFEVQLLKQ